MDGKKTVIPSITAVTINIFIRIILFSLTPKVVNSNYLYVHQDAPDINKGALIIRILIRSQLFALPLLSQYRK